MNISLHAGQWQLTLAPSSSNPSILSFIGRLASNKPSVLVLDGGNRFNALEVAQAVNGNAEILEKINVSRAFTCYQLTNLLETTTNTDTTMVLLDFLSTFYDESAPFHERSQLLTICLAHIRRLNRTNGLLVVTHPPALPSPQATSLIKKLENAANEILPLQILTFESESIGTSDMGKTIPSFAQLFEQVQASLSTFRRALRHHDRLILEELFAMARKHLAAGGLAARPLPFETILLCMLLEEHKEVIRLRELVNELSKQK